MGTANRACGQRVADAQRHHLAELIPDPPQTATMSMSSMATRWLPASAKATALILAIAIGAASLQASSSRFFQAATQAEFLKGDVDNLSVDSQGRLILGPAA